MKFAQKAHRPENDPFAKPDRTSQGGAARLEGSSLKGAPTTRTFANDDLKAPIAKASGIKPEDVLPGGDKRQQQFWR